MLINLQSEKSSFTEAAMSKQLQYARLNLLFMQDKLINASHGLWYCTWFRLPNSFVRVAGRTIRISHLRNCCADSAFMSDSWSEPDHQRIRRTSGNEEKQCMMA